MIGLSESAQSQESDRSLMMQNLFEKGTDAHRVRWTADGLIKAANEAFLNMTDSHSQSVVIDRAFADFLSRGAVDLKVLLDNVKRVGHLRHYRTRLNTDYMGESVGRAFGDAVPGPGQAGRRDGRPRCQVVPDSIVCAAPAADRQRGPAQRDAAGRLFDAERDRRRDDRDHREDVHRDRAGDDPATTGLLRRKCWACRASRCT